jgi:hypothetical protein
MNKRTDTNRLLDDVLATEAEDGFREASLGNMLRLAGRRRRMRVVRRAGIVAATLIVAAFAGMRYFAPKQTLPEVARTEPTSATVAWVTSRPLADAEIVTSQPLLPDQIVSPLQMPDIVHSISGNYREVGDEELLALAAPQVVALVRRGPHEAELLFLSGQTGLQEN